MIFKSNFDANYPKHTRIPNINPRQDLIITEIGYNIVPPLKTQIMQRDLFILHYCVNGKGTFQGKPFEKGYIYVTVPDEKEIHTSDEKEPYETYWISFRGPAAADMFKLCGLPMKCDVYRFEKTEECSKILKRALYNITDESNISETFSLLSAFYSIMAIHTERINVSITNRHNTAKDVATFLSKNFHCDIKIDEVAELFNYSRNHLYALFKNEYGVSPKEYLVNLRIERAKQILTDNSMDFTIKEISFAVGFHDPFYFSKLFSSRVGLSPLQYQKKHAKSE